MSALPKKPTRDPTSSSYSMGSAQKRHERVRKWTKNVNLFGNDFIIVPINQNFHWNLIIICFPGLIIDLGSARAQAQRRRNESNETTQVIQSWSKGTFTLKFKIEDVFY